MDSSWDLPLNLEIGDAPEPRVGGRGRNRPKGVLRLRSELRDGVEYLVEEHAPESGAPVRRGKGRVGKYATSKLRSREAAGSGTSLWTGSQGDRPLLNSPLRHKKSADAWALEHGSLVDAPWDVIGITNLKRAVRAARDHEAENCPPEEVAHVLEDWGEDMEELLRELDGNHD